MACVGQVKVCDVSDRISIERAAGSHIIRQEARSRSATSSRRHSNAIWSRVSAPGRSDETRGHSRVAVGR